MGKRREPNPIEFDKLSKWARKRKRICLGRLLNTESEECAPGCCGELHTKSGICDASLGARCTHEPFISCDCYPVETAIKIAWKIKMGLVEYDR
jgi:hypothetical protein